MRIVTTRAELLSTLDGVTTPWRALVPTMGYLHAGHASLMSAARANNDFVVATVFVNPTQFGPGEDLDRYPRDPDGDAARCREAGVDLLWMPPPGEVYAADHATTVHVSGLTDTLCGSSRPGHFDGVATVVTKLLNLVQPRRAYFGEKDFQQLAVIRRFVRDLDLRTEIVGMPTVRDADGVALSSRNKYLSVDERAQARTIWRALEELRQRWQRGDRDVEELRARLEATLNALPAGRVDYATIVDADDLSAHRGDERPAVAAVAVHVGTTRLIDNARLDRATPLHVPA